MNRKIVRRRQSDQQLENQTDKKIPTQLDDNTRAGGGGIRILMFRNYMQVRREYHNGYIDIIYHTMRNPISCDCCVVYMGSSRDSGSGDSRSEISGDDGSDSSSGGSGTGRSATGRSDSSGSGGGESVVCNSGSRGNSNSSPVGSSTSHAVTDQSGSGGERSGGQGSGVRWNCDWNFY